jgi:glycosyltransferase involved in cell wall biosynthesis
MIYLHADVLNRAGGIESYLHALATHLLAERISFRVVVCEHELCPFVDELVRLGVQCYRQSVVPGDRWQVRKRLMNFWLRRQLMPGDWVFCVRQPSPELYLGLVRAVHAGGARLAASWIFAPEFVNPPKHLEASFAQAVRETDAVISVSRCTAHQFKKKYGFQGEVKIVNYHNLELFKAPVPLPRRPPFRIGYMGRIEIYQKNLDTILQAVAILGARRQDIEFHIYGSGPDHARLVQLSGTLGLGVRLVLHGRYDHRRDLERIISSCHMFVYTSRFEGGPCFSLLELLQAGRYVVTAPVGGIPDIYEGRPDLGLMVAPDDPYRIAAAFEEGLRRVATGQVNQAALRAHYDKYFSMAPAHRAFMQALDLIRADERRTVQHTTPAT